MNFLNPDQMQLSVFTEEKEYEISAFVDGKVTVESKHDELHIALTGGKSAIRFLRLRWSFRFAPETRFLGDAWERTYGDCQWRSGDPARLMPWYFLAKTPDAVFGFGVKVRSGAFALWSADPTGVTLWLDVRSGGKGVILDGRTLDVAAVLCSRYEGLSAFAAGRRFCRELSPAPILPASPVYGANNWYHAYGASTEADILAEAELISRLAGDRKNRPFMVVDDGWQPAQNNHLSAGPWRSSNTRHADMKRLAADIRERGCRPGIWFRPLWNLDPSIPNEWKSQRDPQYLDPSIPGVLDWIKEDIRTLNSWGYELIKHDFSTWDMFGSWGFEMRPWPASGSWSFADRSRTSAEIIVAFYRAIHEAAGQTLILGCNTVGHLGAGLMQIARIGDDTSGRRWERTRKMGVNTLAFRLMQHQAFFDADADCAGVTAAVPWELNAQWMELLAKSGTPFFSSITPGLLTPKQEKQAAEFLAIAAERPMSLEPLDWEWNTSPAQWRTSQGETLNFDWYESRGDVPDFV